MVLTLSRLAQEEEMVQCRRRTEELERENQELATALARREQEADLRQQLARTREKLETEVLCHNETRQRLSAAESRAAAAASTSISTSDMKLVAGMPPPPPPPLAPPPPRPPGPPPPPLDDSKLYKQLDLGEVDRLFSAYQKNGIMVSNFNCKKPSKSHLFVHEKYST
jgi:hypothetical protein